MDQEGIGHVELGGVVPNPHIELVYEGIELAKKEHVDFLLAVGGGSVIDSSKAIAYALAELDKDPSNYEAWAEVMWASSLAHNGLTGCGNDGGDFVSHLLEHEMGGMFDVTHGAGLAAVWPSWADATGGEMGSAMKIHEEDAVKIYQMAL